MTKQEIEKLKQAALKNNLPHNFKCSDQEQQDQVDYWNASNPTAILSLLDRLEKAERVIEWYADKENWLDCYSNDYGNGSMQSDQECDWDDKNECYAGGKRARAWLMENE